MAKRPTRKAAPPRTIMDIAPKAVVHMRAQHARKRLGLIFGSGASKSLKFPDWNQLVERIATHSDVDGEPLLRRLRGADPKGPEAKSLAAITEVLFDHYRSRCVAKQRLRGSLTFLQEQQIRTDWLRLIHEQLYLDIKPEQRDRQIKAHPYLSAFLEIIKSSPLTVNYNFDDTVEKLLLNSRTNEEKISTRGYEVTDQPNAQFQKESGVIYHPNGYLPFVFEDGASADVVFSNDAFQDQLISAATGKYVHLSNHLFRNTCLLVGLSLDDATLQSLLRQNAVSNPGHIHYFVHYISSKKSLDAKTKLAIFRSNFSSYNLYTIFLDEHGIRELAKLILLPPEGFKIEFPNAPKKFVYYLVGAIGAGKSTAAGNFRNLITYDEWIDERLPELARPEDEVKDRVAEIDTWVAEQFHKKNFALGECREGIHIIDRCPLDPLTFGENTERSRKAEALIERITANGAFPIEPGHVIFLDSELSELRIRNSLKHKYWQDENLNKLITALVEVYGPIQKSVVCTMGRSITDVAHEIARVVFLEQYSAVDVGAELKKFAEGAR